MVQMFMLQQYLPFTVLKLSMALWYLSFHYVATVLTVYGIETLHIIKDRLVGMSKLQQYLPFTVLKLLAVAIHNR